MNDKKTYYVIEKGHPIPKDMGRKTAPKWPFSLMVVDDRVTVKNKNEWRSAVRAAHATRANRLFPKDEWMFRCKWHGEYGHIWRVK